MRRGRPSISEKLRAYPKTITLTGKTRDQIESLEKLLPGMTDPRGNCSKVIAQAVDALYRECTQNIFG